MIKIALQMIDIPFNFFLNLFAFIDKLVFSANYTSQDFKSGLIVVFRKNREGDVTSITLTRNREIAKKEQFSDTMRSIQLVVNSNEWMALLDFVDTKIERSLPARWACSDTTKLVYHDDGELFFIQIDDLVEIFARILNKNS